MKTNNKRKGFTIVELVIVIAVIAILAAVLIPTFGNIIDSAQESAAKQEAKNAYTNYIIENNGVASEYMVYDADGRWVALHNGAAVGVYDTQEEALAAMVVNPQPYRAVRFLTENMYHVLDLSDFIGKKIACIGDSVTSPSFVTGGGANYVKNLGSALGTTPINLGTAGNSLCDGGSRTCQFSKLNENALQSAEIVTIYLGVNDWDATGSKEGKAYYELGTPDSTDTSTIYGAMKMWCNKIEELKGTEQYKNTMFFFITPHLTSWNGSVSNNRSDWNPHKRNVHGYTQKEMNEAIKTVCNEYGIPVIDMYDYTVRLYNQNPTKFVQEYGGDGIHPTAAGHELMADYILYELAGQ